MGRSGKPGGAFPAMFCQVKRSALIYRSQTISSLKYGFTIIDAMRMADGEIVTLKKIDKSIHPYEADIALYFSSEPQRSDPHNHCVPIYEVLSVPNDPDKIILVTPMFRKFD